MAISICQAIALFEGFQVPDSRSARNHNPGNIEYCKLAAQFGASLETIPKGYNEKARFASFSKDKDGFDCLSTLLNDNYIGMTVSNMLARYAPNSENNTTEYVDFVCEKTGLQPFDVLTPGNIG